MIEGNYKIFPCEDCLAKTNICPVLKAYLDLEYSDLGVGDNPEIIRRQIFSTVAGILIMRMLANQGFQLKSIQCSGQTFATFSNNGEAFGDLTPNIKVAETGLSSDPFMNWRLSQLDGITMISNSDAHSAAKLAREANILDCEVNYDDILGALTTGDKRFVGTIEFFPEEGKYHLDGHRLCNFSCTADKTKELDGICPICKKPLVIGVDYRVSELADRAHDFKPKKHKKVEYIIPLVEVISELKSVKSTNSKTVKNEFENLVSQYGSEFDILRKLPIDSFNKSDVPNLKFAIKKIRTQDVYVQAGYDGVFGTIKVFGADSEKRSAIGQLKMEL